MHSESEGYGRLGRGEVPGGLSALGAAGDRLRFWPGSLVNNPDVQRLMVDPSLVAVAQAYIGANPVLDEVNMWWTTSSAGKADSAAAQLYHFDMDRICWLKVFVYLTDVSDDNGPHNFVAGSHRTGAIPPALLNKGYARLTDAEVSGAFGAEKMKSFTGPRGTILLEDTRGLHKGTPARAGDRLMFELEFSSSMFGAAPVMTGKIHTYHSDGIRQWIEFAPTDVPALDLASAALLTGRRVLMNNYLQILRIQLAPKSGV